MVSGQIYQPSQHLQSSKMIRDYVSLVERKMAFKKNYNKEKTSTTLCSKNQTFKNTTQTRNKY